MKWSFCILFLFLVTTLTSQETCNDSAKLIEDLNTISINKCVIKDPEKKRRIYVNPKLGKNRFLTIRKKSITTKKSIATKKSSATSVRGLINTKGIEKIVVNKEPESLESLIALEKKYVNTTVETFKSVDEIPVFKGCRNISSSRKRHYCFNNEMIKFITENINYSDEVLDEGILGRIFIKFVIDADGKTYNIQVSGPKKAYELKEAVIDLVSKLPKFKPAKKENKEVPVSYEFSLNFSI